MKGVDEYVSEHFGQRVRIHEYADGSCSELGVNSFLETFDELDVIFKTTNTRCIISSVISSVSSSSECWR